MERLKEEEGELNRCCRFPLRSFIRVFVESFKLVRAWGPSSPQDKMKVQILIDIQVCFTIEGAMKVRGIKIHRLRQ